MLDGKGNSYEKEMLNPSQDNSDGRGSGNDFAVDENIKHSDVKASNASRTSSRGGGVSFVDKNKFGVADPDEVDFDVAELIADKTPQTQRRIIKEEGAKNVGKLGPMATCFTIFKGFVATGILYVPKDFYNGGYIFTPITLIASLIITLYCAKLLLAVNDRIGGGSFPEMGFKAYGKPGKIFVEVVLVASQFGFCTAYVYFIAS